MPETRFTSVPAIRFTARVGRAQFVKSAKWLLISSVVSYGAFQAASFLLKGELRNAAEILIFVAISAAGVAAVTALGLLWKLVEHLVSSWRGVQIPQLHLDAQGFVFQSVLKRKEHAWNDISEFRVVESQSSESPPDYELVASTKDEDIPFIPPQLRAPAKVVIGIPGLGASDRLSHEKSCRWLNRWRAWAMEGGMQPSLADLDFIQGDVKVEVVLASN